MIPAVVGISGKMGSGKSALAGALVSRGATRVSFADPVRRIAAELGWDGAKDERGRRLLQSLGVMAREYDPDVWVRMWEARADEIIRGGGRVVADDVRFPNEAEVIRSRGGIVVRVEPRSDRARDSDADAHISETAMDGYAPDVVWHNDFDAASIAAIVERIEHHG